VGLCHVPLLHVQHGGRSGAAAGKDGTAPAVGYRACLAEAKHCPLSIQ
jgi:hypothetical protein